MHPRAVLHISSHARFRRGWPCNPGEPAVWRVGQDAGTEAAASPCAHGAGPSRKAAGAAALDAACAEDAAAVRCLLEEVGLVSQAPGVASPRPEPARLSLGSSGSPTAGPGAAPSPERGSGGAAKRAKTAGEPAAQPARAAPVLRAVNLNQGRGDRMRRASTDSIEAVDRRAERVGAAGGGPGGASFAAGTQGTVDSGAWPPLQRQREASPPRNAAPCPYQWSPGQSPGTSAAAPATGSDGGDAEQGSRAAGDEGVGGAAAAAPDTVSGLPAGPCDKPDVPSAHEAAPAGAAGNRLPPDPAPTGSSSPMVPAGTPVSASRTRVGAGASRAACQPAEGLPRAAGRPHAATMCRPGDAGRGSPGGSKPMVHAAGGAAVAGASKPEAGSGGTGAKTAAASAAAAHARAGGGEPDAAAGAGTGDIYDGRAAGAVGGGAVPAKAAAGGGGGWRRRSSAAVGDALMLLGIAPVLARSSPARTPRRPAIVDGAPGQAAAPGHDETLPGGPGTAAAGRAGEPAAFGAARLYPASAASRGACTGAAADRPAGKHPSPCMPFSASPACVAEHCVRPGACIG